MREPNDRDEHKYRLPRLSNFKQITPKGQRGKKIKKRMEKKEESDSLLTDLKKRLNLLQEQVSGYDPPPSGYVFFKKMCDLYDELRVIYKLKGLFFNEMAVGSTMGDELCIIRNYNVYQKGNSIEKLRKLMQREIERVKRDFSDIFK